MMLTWLDDVLRDAGLTVVETDGWRTRGADMGTVYGVVGHDTVTTTGWSDQSVADLLRDGRPDLDGPLSQCGLDRDGAWWLIAAGLSAHNGYGLWANDAVGVEVFCAGGLEGREEPWNQVQQDSFCIGAAAILDRLDLGESSHWNPRVAGHKETDPARKIDPYGIDMDAIRARVATTLNAPQEDVMSPEQEKRLAASLTRIEDRQRQDRAELDDRLDELDDRLDKLDAEVADTQTRQATMIQQGLAGVLRRLTHGNDERNAHEDDARFGAAVRDKLGL